MAKPKLYRPRGIHGVEMLITADALRAHREMKSYFDLHGSYVGLDRSVQLRIGFGTFTFVSLQSFALTPGSANRHYGMHATLDFYTREVFDVERVAESMYVPFTHEPRYTDDLRKGYGTNQAGYYFLVDAANARSHA